MLKNKTSSFTHRIEMNLIREKKNKLGFASTITVKKCCSLSGEVNEGEMLSWGVRLIILIYNRCICYDMLSSDHKNSYSLVHAGGHSVAWSPTNLHMIF